tara:strand:+ start:1237 stop:1389 length:153 start_codon:yes stop_codon:yes gene_type:complete
MESTCTDSLTLPLLLFATLYGGMACITGMLGAKQVALGARMHAPRQVQAS